MWRMDERNRSKCAECGCDLLAGANKHPVPGFVAAIQFVRRVTGRNVFICSRCAVVRQDTVSTTAGKVFQTRPVATSLAA